MPNANFSNYVYDGYMAKPKDHIMALLAGSFIHSDNGHTPTWVRASGERVLYYKTAHALLFLHKLGVRP